MDRWYGYFQTFGYGAGCLDLSLCLSQCCRLIIGTMLSVIMRDERGRGVLSFLSAPKISSIRNSNLAKKNIIVIWITYGPRYFPRDSGMPLDPEFSRKSGIFHFLSTILFMYELLRKVMQMIFIGPHSAELVEIKSISPRSAIRRLILCEKRKFCLIAADAHHWELP